MHNYKYVALFHVVANNKRKDVVYHVIHDNLAHFLYEHFILAHYEEWHTSHSKLAFKIQYNITYEMKTT